MMAQVSLFPMKCSSSLSQMVWNVREVVETNFNEVRHHYAKKLLTWQWNPCDANEDPWRNHHRWARDNHGHILTWCWGWANANNCRRWMSAREWWISSAWHCSPQWPKHGAMLAPHSHTRQPIDRLPPHQQCLPEPERCLLWKQRSPLWLPAGAPRWLVAWWRRKKRCRSSVSDCHIDEARHTT